MQAFMAQQYQQIQALQEQQQAQFQALPSALAVINSEIEALRQPTPAEASMEAPQAPIPAPETVTDHQASSAKGYSTRPA